MMVPTAPASAAASTICSTSMVGDPGNDRAIET